MSATHIINKKYVARRTSFQTGLSSPLITCVFLVIPTHTHV